MSKFNINEYQEVKERAAEGSNFADRVKVGFFKLKDHGDQALVRINCSKLEDLDFATVHQLGAAAKYMKVSCMNKIGDYSDNCPFCAAVNAGNTAIGKAAKKCYVQMLVSYIDKTTGNLSAPIPVIWERPAGFSSELATKLKQYGDLRESLFTITRNGKAGARDTSYSVDYAVPTVFKPEFIPADFSAFENFRIDKHSYWEKSVDEMNTFLTTGAFPEIQKATPQVNPTPTPEVKPLPNSQPTANIFGQTISQDQVAQPAQQPAQPATQPSNNGTRNFGQFW